MGRPRLTDEEKKIRAEQKKKKPKSKAKKPVYGRRKREKTYELKKIVNDYEKLTGKTVFWESKYKRVTIGDKRMKEDEAFDLMRAKLLLSSNPDLIPGGKASGKPDSNFDADQLSAGIKVELEHTTDPEIAKEIAKDHLTEDADYYKKLAIMENSSLEQFEDSFAKSARLITEEDTVYKQQFDALPVGTRIEKTVKDYKQSYVLRVIDEEEGWKAFVGEKDGLPLSDGGQVVKNVTIMRIYGNDMIPPEAVPERPLKENTETVPRMKKILLGREIQLAMPNGEKRRGQFAIVELGEIIASHDEENFHSSPGYPTNEAGYNINDRNYKDDPAAQKAVMDYARNLEPERLITTSRTPSGTPIISKDGIVVSGNNRTMSLKLAAKEYPENFTAYVQYLGEEAEAFGFSNIVGISLRTKDSIALPGSSYNDPKTVKFDHPVLVRIDYDIQSLTTSELAKYNKDTKKAERPIDKAIKLSNILRDSPGCADIIAETTGEFDTFTDFYGSAVAQKKLSRTLVDCNLLTEQELPSYFTGATFTESGKEFIENLLAALILDRDALQQTEMPGVKSLRAKIITSLPVLMKNANLTEGSLKQFINEAVKLQHKIVTSGNGFNDFIRQYTVFDDKYNRKAVYLNRLLDAGKMKFKAAIEGYNASIIANQGSMLFGDNVPPDKVFDHWIVRAVDPTEARLIEQSKIVKENMEAEPVIVEPVSTTNVENREPWQLSDDEFIALVMQRKYDFPINEGSYKNISEKVSDYWKVAGDVPVDSLHWQIRNYHKKLVAEHGAINEPGMTILDKAAQGLLTGKEFNEAIKGSADNKTDIEKIYPIVKRELGDEFGYYESDGYFNVKVNKPGQQDIKYTVFESGSDQIDVVNENEVTVGNIYGYGSISEAANKVIDAIKKDIQKRFEGTEVFYTSAPVDYDGFGTVTIEMTEYYDDQGKQIRKVAVQPANIRWQTQRNNSGRYRLDNETEFQLGIGYGLYTKKVTEPDVSTETNYTAEPVSMEYKLSQARQIGFNAWVAGKNRVPAQDVEWDKFSSHYKLQVGEGAPYLQEWSKGWDNANLQNPGLEAEPEPEPNKPHITILWSEGKVPTDNIPVYSLDELQEWLMKKHEPGVGGYNKVKIQFADGQTTRVDVGEGSFNPTKQHIRDYFKQGYYSDYTFNESTMQFEQKGNEVEPAVVQQFEIHDPVQFKEDYDGVKAGTVGLVKGFEKPDRYTIYLGTMQDGKEIKRYQIPQSLLRGVMAVTEMKGDNKATYYVSGVVKPEPETDCQYANAPGCHIIQFSNTKDVDKWFDQFGDYKKTPISKLSIYTKEGHEYFWINHLIWENSGKKFVPIIYALKGYEHEYVSPTPEPEPVKQPYNGENGKYPWLMMGNMGNGTLYIDKQVMKNGDYWKFAQVDANGDLYDSSEGKKKYKDVIADIIRDENITAEKLKKSSANSDFLLTATPAPEPEKVGTLDGERALITDVSNKPAILTGSISLNFADYADPYLLNRAIEALLKTHVLDEQFTVEEKAFLTGYTGYGGLDKYAKKYKEAIQEGTFTEFYTPDKIVQQMWGLAYQNGFTDDQKVLETSAGIGAFLKYAPDLSLVTAVEMNPVSGRILKILFKEARVLIQKFERVFIRDNESTKNKSSKWQIQPEFGLVIGNPPYGSWEGREKGMGEGSYTKATDIVEYFIFRGLDLLKPGGLLIYIEGAEPATGGKTFLQTGANSCKRMIAEKCEFVRAIRMPNDVFDRTGVTSEIVILRKK